MKGYKAFKKGLICDPTGKKPFQFAENTVFEQDEEAAVCKSGFHFCENPLDTLDYYPLIDGNGELTEFAEVEALDEVKTEGNKSVTRKLKIGAKLTLAGFINASFDVMYESIKKAATNTKSKNKDDLIKAGGSYSQLAGGSYSQLAGGYNSKLAGGDNSKLAGGKHSVMIGDNGSIAKGKKGALIVLVEREVQNGEYVIKSFKAEIVDGERIKEDTLYKLVNGEFVEVK